MKPDWQIEKSMYNKTKIFQNVLEDQNDSLDQYRRRLVESLWKFRERVGQLVATVPKEVPGLTVHDLTHMDSLWEMVDILTKGEYSLNPAELYVLGGAILLHDSGMTIHAYPEGVSGIEILDEYSDSLSYFLSQLGDVPNKEAEAKSLATAETLRLKHAEKAQELAQQSWPAVLGEDKSYLIEDSELRAHFAHSIGLVAHSHHWPIEQLEEKLNQVKGAFTEFPTDWKVDEVKLALLLRCADAMHIDDRRAPTFTSSLRPINDVSMVHWTFQNKLAKAVEKDRKLIYTSKSPFTCEESLAWNLCFDTLQMIDKELRDTNDVLERLGLSPFFVQGVLGASSPESLTQHVQVEGWTPLPLNLQVSDVPGLAMTLGGKDLYNEPLTPLRELIQNAADAIEARAVIEDDFELEDGSITIKISEEGDDTIVEVMDDGVGMSEAVLTRTLLDFGTSFWRSSSARQEYPGLQKHTNRFRGRYGIGFFSVFMWSSNVSVSSRRYEKGTDSVNTLEFSNGINTRPILKKADKSEVSRKWNTRIRLNLGSRNLDELITPSIPNQTRYHLVRKNIELKQELKQELKRMCGPLNIKVILKDERDNTNVNVSLPEWETCSPEEFSMFFNGITHDFDDEAEKFIHTMSNVKLDDLTSGRLFVSPYDKNHIQIPVYEKGLFISTYRNNGYGMVNGILESKTTNAARDRLPEIELYDNCDWATDIMSKSFKINDLSLGERLKLQQFFSSINCVDYKQIAFFLNREMLSLEQLMVKVKECGSFQINLGLERAHNENVTNLSWSDNDSLSGVITGLNINSRLVHPITPTGERRKSEYMVRLNIGFQEFLSDIEGSFKKSNDYISTVFNHLISEIGNECNIEYEIEKKYSYSDDKILKIIVTKK